MKKLLIILAVLFLAIAPTFTQAQEESYTIGIVLKSFSNPFWLMAKTAAEAEAQAEGVNVIVLGITEEGDYNEQVSHIEDLVTRGVDLIVVVPAEASALVPAVEAAVDQGIPVINLDSPIETDKVISFIGSDNVEGGRMAGEYVADQLNGEGKVAVIRGRLGNPVELQRYTGFTEAIANYSGIELVAEGVGNWEADQGYTVMEDFLTAHPDIQAVFAESDRMILGASQAAAAANRSDIVLVGLDGIVEALRAVKDGSISADVAQRPDLMGQYAVKYGLEYLKTGNIDKQIYTPMTLALPDNVQPLIDAWESLGFTQPGTEQQYTIGIVLKSFSNPFWLMAKTAAEAEAQAEGVNVIVLGITEEGDYNEQVSHIEDLVTRGVDLIVVVPAEASALVPAVEAAVDQGIPVINLDSPIETDKVISFIGSDNVEGGRMAGEYVADQLNGEGKVAVIRGRLGNPVELQRYTGFTEAIANYSGIELVAEGVGNWEADQGYTVMEDFLTAHPDIQAVFAESDRMILGASQAAAAANRSDIVLVGLDGIVEALRAVKDGSISADVAQRPDLMGQYAVKYGLEYLKTGNIDKQIYTPMTLALPDNVQPLIDAWESLGF